MTHQKETHLIEWVYLFVIDIFAYKLNQYEKEYNV